MNILHISSATSWRGGEQQISYLIDELHSLGHSSFLMHPINAPIADHTLVKGKCTALPYRKGFSINPLVAKKIKKVVSQHNIDIIHAHDSHAHTFLYLSYRLFGMKCPSVVSRRVDFAISASSLKKYNYPKIRKIICVSQKINEIVSDSLGTSDRIVTVHSGVDKDKFNLPSRINLREKYSIPDSHKIIANVSAIAGHKDYETFVITAQNILKERQDVRFLIIGGDGGNQENIAKMITRLGLDDHIEITGYIDNAYQVIKQIDVFLFPSKTEGLGTSILDAQASGTPVVSTYAGGIPELITHNETGLLSQIGDAKDLAQHIHSFLNDSALTLRITESARANVIKYSKKHTAQKTLDIYKNVM